MSTISFEFFSANAQEAVFGLSRIHAEKLQLPNIGTDVLWLGLMTPTQSNRADTPITLLLKKSFQLSRYNVYDAVEAVSVRALRRTESGYTPEAVTVLRNTVNQARKTGRVKGREPKVTRILVFENLIKYPDAAFMQVIANLTQKNSAFNLERLDHELKRNIRSFTTR